MYLNFYKSIKSACMKLLPCLMSVSSNIIQSLNVHKKASWKFTSQLNHKVTNGLILVKKVISLHFSFKSDKFYLFIHFSYSINENIYRRHRFQMYSTHIIYHQLLSNLSFNVQLSYNKEVCHVYYHDKVYLHLQKDSCTQFINSRLLIPKWYVAD